MHIESVKYYFVKVFILQLFTLFYTERTCFWARKLNEDVLKLEFTVLPMCFDKYPRSKIFLTRVHRSWESENV